MTFWKKHSIEIDLPVENSVLYHGVTSKQYQASSLGLFLTANTFSFGPVHSLQGKLVSYIAVDRSFRPAGCNLEGNAFCKSKYVGPRRAIGPPPRQIKS